MDEIKDLRVNNWVPPQPIALTIGNFDGCHLGHQSLINAVLAHACRENLLATVLTFDPAPEQFFKGEAGRSPRLFSIDQKVRAFIELGVDIAIIESFDQALAELTHNEFFEQLILAKLHTRQLVVGYDFKFGKERKGNTSFLAEACQDASILFVEGESINFEGEPISSTRIRQAITRGDMIAAQRMLGRPYLLSGHVQHGQKKGRTLGFPTANLGGCSQLLPRLGVYVGWAAFDDGSTVMKIANNAVPVVINVGIRPTLAGEPIVRVEAHCFTTKFGDDELYQRPFALYFHERLRDEQKFAGLAELTAAIANDISQAELILSRLNH